MITDLQRFISREQPYWDELDSLITDLELHAERTLSYDEARRVHYLYQRAASDLARLKSLPYQPQIRQRLEPLVARTYAEIHSARARQDRFSPLRWFWVTFPQTFRRRFRAFVASLVITLLGVAFGGGVVYMDPASKATILPFSHLMGDPAKRVAEEEASGKEDAPKKDRLAGHKATFSAQLMANNIGVSIKALALGMSWGLGTVLVLFQNGVILGAVAVDYCLAGQTPFLAGWLLPHGVIEIPSILIAGQAGLLLGWTLIGWGSSHSVRARLRLIREDLVTLIMGVALMLVWAGIVEAFFSQYHQPVLPYALKIAFGLFELVLLIVFLSVCGRRATNAKDTSA